MVTIQPLPRQSSYADRPTRLLPSSLTVLCPVFQVQEASQAVAAARQRKKSPSKKEREVAWKALKERDAIIKMMDAL